jgi:prevent-host-death family protein
MASRKMGAAEFKAQCLRVLDDVEQSGDSVTITKRGRPVAELRALEKTGSKLTFGCMKETVLGFEDPFSPAYDGPWNAEKGILVSED